MVIIWFLISQVLSLTFSFDLICIEGARTTLSVVVLNPKVELLVGIPAKRQAVTNPTSTQFRTKSLTGMKFNDQQTEKI